MMGNESLLIAFEKVRQGFTAVQALPTSQNEPVDPHTPTLNGSNRSTYIKDIVAQAANQLSVAIRQLELIEQVEAEQRAEQTAKLTDNKNRFEAILDNSIG